MGTNALSEAFAAGNLLKAKKIPPPDAKIGVTDCWFGPKYQRIAAMKDQLEQGRKEAQSAGGTRGMATRAILRPRIKRQGDENLFRSRPGACLALLRQPLKSTALPGCSTATQSSWAARLL